MAFLNKHRALFFAIITLLCFCITKDIHADEQIFSSGFEETTSNWKTTNSGIIFNILNDPVAEGTQSAGLLNNSSNTYGIEHVIPDIAGNTDYVISGFIKTNDPPPSKTFIRIAWYPTADATGAQIDTEDSEIVTSITNWKELNIYTTSPENALSAKIRLMVSSGFAYFDKISFSNYIVPIPTPSVSENTIPTVTPTLTVSPIPILATNIHISEVMVYPEAGQYEWIELYNDHDSQVTLENWYIDDIADGGAAYKPFSLIIPAKGYASYDLSTSIFNNSGDDVRLLSSNLEVISTMNYSTSKRGVSIGKRNDSFCLQTPSKNKLNNSCEIEEISSPTPTKSQNKTPIISKTVSKTPLVKNISIQNSRPVTISAENNQADEDVLGIETIELPQENTERDYSSVLHFVAGSNSLLALISLVSKTFIFRYT